MKNKKEFKQYRLLTVLLVFYICSFNFSGAIEASELKFEFAWTKGLPYNTYSVYSEKMPDNTILVGSVYDSHGGSCYAVFTRINSNGDVLSSVSVQEKFGTWVRIKKVGDNYILYGGGLSYDQGKVVLLDANFNKLWSVTNTDYYTTVYNVFRIADNFYSIYLDDYGDHYNYYIQKISMSGEVLTTSGLYVPPAERFNVTDVVVCDDSTFIVTGVYKNSSNNVYGYIGKYNLELKAITYSYINLNITTSYSLTQGVGISTKLSNGNIATTFSFNGSNRIVLYDQNINIINSVDLSSSYSVKDMLELQNKTLLMFLYNSSEGEPLYIINVDLNLNTLSSKTFILNGGRLSTMLSPYLNGRTAIQVGKDIYVFTGYTGSYSTISEGYTSKLAYIPPTATISTNTPNIGDNTPVMFSVNVSDTYSYLYIHDVTNNTGIWSGVGQTPVRLDLDFEGNKSILVQILDADWSILNTSNVLTFNKRNVLNNVLAEGSNKSGMEKVFIISDTARYYENNWLNQSLVQELKKKVSGIYLISNTVSDVLNPLLKP